MKRIPIALLAALALSGCVDFRNRWEIEKALFRHEMSVIHFRDIHAKEIKEFEANIKPEEP